MSEKTEEKPWRVLGLHVENMKRAELVHLVPNKRLTVIRGKNRAGKSSVGDAFVAAIGGKRMRPPELLRRGADEGRSVVDLGPDTPELHVELIVTADGKETFEVTNSDGVPQRGPQELLNGLIGPQRSQFDPLAFLQLKAADQAEHVRLAVGLDFTEIDEERQRIYDDRTLVGREVTSAKSRLAALPRPSDDEDQVVDTMGLLKQQEELLAQQREREQLASTAREAAIKRDALAQEGKTLKVALEQMEAELAALQQRIANAKLQRQGLEDRWKKSSEEARKAQVLAEQAPDPDMDLTMIRTKLETAEKHTERALKKKERDRLNSELKAKEEEHAALQRKLDAIDLKKDKLIAQAKFPLEGLGFSRGGSLIFKDLPFEQAAQSEQLRAAVALGLASKPRLRTMWINKGSFLDEDGLVLLEQILEEFDAQALIEMVGKEGKGPCVVIEAGRVEEVRE